MKDEEKAVKLFHGVTNVGDDLIEEAGGLYGGGPDAVMERLDSYQMPNGCVAETFTIDRTAVEGWTYSTCISFFIKDGNMYEVCVDGELADPARLWPEVQAVLDSFQ